MRVAAAFESSTGAPVATATTSSIESLSPTRTVMAGGGYAVPRLVSRRRGSHTCADGRPIIRRSGQAPNRAMSNQEPPVGIDRKEHRDLEGRQHRVWQRRVALSLAAVFPILGLLNVFGQRARLASVDSAGASLSVDSPARVRG